MAQFGGGGHAKAASASFRLIDGPSTQYEGLEAAEDVVQTMVGTVLAMYDRPNLTLRDFMTAPVLTADHTDSIGKVSRILDDRQLDLIPVVGVGGKLLGLAKTRDVIIAEQRGFGERPITSAMKLMGHFPTMRSDLSLRDVECVFGQHDTAGVFPVLSTDGSDCVEGLVTRTDLLRQQAYYKSLHYHNKGFSVSLEKRSKWLELREKLKKFELD